jgi:transposase
MNEITESSVCCADLEEELSHKTAYIAQLESYIKQLRHKTFSPSSEKLSPDQLGLFNEAEETALSGVGEAETPITVASHERARQPRVAIPDDLPRETLIYDLNDDEKVCPHDGTVLTQIGSEDHEQLDIIPAQVKVLRHCRLKYACSCCHQHIVTASKPRQPIEKSIASAGLLAYVAVQKYCDALPLYRQSAIFSRLGIRLDRANLANWMIKVGELVQPLINLLHEHILEQPLVHMDETTLQVLNEPGKTPQSRSYMWLLACFHQQPVMIFHYATTRHQSVPLEQLSTDTQALMVDGYQGYQPACDDYDILRLGCWAHARRKFVEAKRQQLKGKTGKADQALAFIQKLYAIERHITDEPPDQRLSIRQQQAKPVIDKLQAWLEQSLVNTLPKTALGKALHYLHHQWPRLIRYLDDGTYPIDNNLAENAIRPFVVGRKNWLFSNSQAGAKASANLYSLIQTAKANGINPYEYLKLVFKEMPNVVTVNEVEKLLPWNIKHKLYG